jgi:hypothetical protein
VPVLNFRHTVFSLPPVNDGERWSQDTDRGCELQQLHRAYAVHCRWRLGREVISALRSGLTIASLGVAMALFAAPTATAQQGGESAPSMTASSLAPADAKFMKEAADGGMAEVELGQLASENQFGQRMAEDHGKANDELKKLAMQKHALSPGFVLIFTDLSTAWCP